VYTGTYIATHDNGNNDDDDNSNNNNNNNNMSGRNAHTHNMRRTRLLCDQQPRGQE